MTTYNNDKNAVSAVQKAVNGAGYSPALTVNGLLDADTSKGIAWLQSAGGTAAPTGIVDDTLLAALGIQGSFQPDPPPPTAPTAIAPAPAPSVKPVAVLATAGLFGAMGFALGGPAGGVIGAGVGSFLGVILSLRATST